MPEYPATRTADISDLFMRSIPTKVLIYNNDRSTCILNMDTIWNRATIAKEINELCH